MQVIGGTLFDLKPKSLLLAVSLAVLHHMSESGGEEPDDLRCRHFSVFDDVIPGEDLPNS